MDWNVFRRRVVALLSLLIVSTPRSLFADDSTVARVTMQPEYHQFDQHPLPEGARSCVQPVAADIDGNGASDLYCYHTGEPVLERLLFATDGGGVERQTVELQGRSLAWQFATVGDIDNDGQAELMAPAGSNANEDVLIRGANREVKFFPLLLPEHAPILHHFLSDRSCERRTNLLTVRVRTPKGIFQQVYVVSASDLVPGGTAIVPAGDVAPFVEMMPGGCSAYITAIDSQIIFYHGLSDSTAGQRMPLPDLDTPRPIGVGDFLGDEVPQLLIYSGQIRGWFLASLRSPAPQFRSVTGLPRVLDAGDRVVIGDFDGDGLSDVMVSRSRGKGTLEWYQSQSGAPIANLPVNVKGVNVNGENINGQPVVTDSKGEIRIKGPLSERIELSISLPGGIVSSRTLDRRKNHTIALPPTVYPQLRQGAYAQEGPSLTGPYVCLGMASGDSNTNPDWAECPSGHYLFSPARVTRGEAHAGAPTMPGVCCPLPDPALLGKVTHEALGTCPENSIVTGISRSYPQNVFPMRIRCTELNTSRARTSPPLPGAYFGPRTGPVKVNAASAPVAIRWALGRQSMRTYSVHGCVGVPWGAPLTGYLGRQCDEFRFSKLITPEGLPIVMFPSCTKLTSTYDPRAGCAE